MEAPVRRTLRIRAICNETRVAASSRFQSVSASRRLHVKRKDFLAQQTHQPSEFALSIFRAIFRNGKTSMQIQSSSTSFDFNHGSMPGAASFAPGGALATGGYDRASAAYSLGHQQGATNALQALNPASAGGLANNGMGHAQTRAAYAMGQQDGAAAALGGGPLIFSPETMASGAGGAGAAGGDVAGGGGGDSTAGSGGNCPNGNCSSGAGGGGAAGGGGGGGFDIGSLIKGLMSLASAVGGGSGLLGGGAGGMLGGGGAS
jgi:hypothetical protein